MSQNSEDVLKELLEQARRSLDKEAVDYKRMASPLRVTVFRVSGARGRPDPRSPGHDLIDHWSAC